MRLGVDVGGTNTDAVLMHGDAVAAWTKQPTSSDVGSGVAAAVTAVLDQAGVRHDAVSRITIGTTHFANALVERRALERIGILRLASPSGTALPPMTGWPTDLVACLDARVFLLPGGHEVDGREIAPLDEAAVRDAARALRRDGVTAIAIVGAFAPMNAAMEERAAALVRAEHPDADLTLSHAIGRLGLVERENAAILNAALSPLARRVVASFGSALRSIGLEAPLYLSQNDGTLVGCAQAAAQPVASIGSGPTNSMRGAAFLTGVEDAMVMDVGGTTTDIGVLAHGFPRESSITVDIGGVRTNARMPDILSIGLGGGSRIHLDPSLWQADVFAPAALRVGPDSVGYRIAEEGFLFGGGTLVASDIALAAGIAGFGDPARLPALSPTVVASILARFRQLLEDGLDRMKTARGDATILAVGGGAFLIPDTLRGASRVLRPEHAAVANAVGAAIAQVGAQVERIVDYDRMPRSEALETLRAEARAHVVAAGGDADSTQVVEVDEVFLSYLPGRAAQVRVKAVADLAASPRPPARAVAPSTDVRHAH
ncbi:MAG: hydantoinase/oxoprolinase family protein [Luteimonas sp.]|nr:hydantoinase/oxoprolinase family protein [Luteimonas sp.]